MMYRRGVTPIISLKTRMKWYSLHPTRRASSPTEGSQPLRWRCVAKTRPFWRRIIWKYPQAAASSKCTHSACHPVSDQ